MGLVIEEENLIENITYDCVDCGRETSGYSVQHMYGVYLVCRDCLQKKKDRGEIMFIPRKRGIIKRGLEIYGYVEIAVLE